MLELWASWIQSSRLSIALSQSIWVYPLINAGHIIGIGLLIGSIASLNLRILGCWASIPFSYIARVLIPMSKAGLALGTTFGILLFVTQPLQYLSSSLFKYKMILIVLTALNAYVALRGFSWSNAMRFDAIHFTLKLHAIASIGLWLSIAVLGRLIGYR